MKLGLSEEKAKNLISDLIIDFNEFLWRQEYKMLLSNETIRDIYLKY